MLLLFSIHFTNRESTLSYRNVKNKATAHKHIQQQMSLVLALLARLVGLMDLEGKKYAH